MNKIAFILPLLLFSHLCSAQFWSMMEVKEIPYDYANPTHSRVMIRDSSLYTIRNGGLQIKNRVTLDNDYRWAEHYAMRTVLPDGKGNYFFLKDSSFIARYDTLLQSYQNINLGPLMNFYINDIGISPNGNIWATANNVLGIYDGTSWQLFPYSSNINNIKIISDTSAYVLGNEVLFFHQGLFTSMGILPSNFYYKDWDVDTLGTLWIEGEHEIHVIPNVLSIIFDSTDAPFGSDKLKQLVAGRNGHIWVSGSANKLYEYNGITWIVHALPIGYIYIDNFNLDSLSRPWVIAGNYYYSTSSFYNTKIYIYNGTSFTQTIDFLFNPYCNATALVDGAISNKYGIFYFDQQSTYPPFRILDYHGVPDYVNTANVNAFEANYPSNPNPPYATNQGIYGIAGLDTSLLPSQIINHVMYDGGSHYISTDSGLVIFDGTIYSYIDTSNAPLPSNKITFTIISHVNPYNKLYIGTDRGIAIYENTQWTVYDTSNIIINNFNVTGVLPGIPYYYDSTTYITTMGGGLIKLYPSGTYDILSTSTGTFQDDSLYYVKYAFLAKCGEFIFCGTKHHGIASWNGWSGNIEYANTSTGYSFDESCAASELFSFNYGSGILVGTNTGIYYAFPCSGIRENSPGITSLKWFIDRNNLFITPPPNMYGDVRLKIFDILGREIITTKENVSPNQKISIPVVELNAGIYLVKLKTNKEEYGVKFVKE